MPIRLSHDKNGYYYQYGTTGKKYYFIKGNKLSQNIAYNNSLRQLKAIKASKKK